MTILRTALSRCLPATLCLLVFSATPAVAQDKPNKVVRETLVSNNKKRTYYLLVPASISAPAPLIVLLHGSNRNGESLTDKWKDLAIKEGFVIVAPDSGGEGWSSPRDGPQFLLELVEELKSKYPINPKRIYLFGHSAGAVFALVMSMYESEFFAATAIHAGAFRSREELQTINSATRKIPIAIWVGTRDQFFPLTDVRATRDAFQAKGFPIEVTEMSGHDHWYYDLAPQINAAAWTFLKKYELPNDPKHAEYVDLGSGAGAGDNANQTIAEINSLNARARALIQRANEKEAQLDGRDFRRDHAEVVKIAQEHMDILADSAALWRTAAQKAEAAARTSSGKEKEYLTLIMQYYQKGTALVEIMRERSAALLSSDPYDVIQAKRSEAQKRADKLHLEIEQLQFAIDSMR